MRQNTTDRYTLINGDCVEAVSQMPDNSVHFEIFSPPFANLYIYSDDLRDMGNCKNEEEFFEQFDFLIPELYRVLMNGRLCAVHCKQLARYKTTHGAAGWYDFRGDVIRHFEKAGFVYHSEVVIWTDPVLEMQKTKTQRLLYCQLQRDASHTGIGMPEYLLLFRKWEGDGKTDEPIRHYKSQKEAEAAGADESQVMDLEVWQKYASPVWFDIRRTDVLNANGARTAEDEKHICLAEGTLVLTKRGYVPIETVVPYDDEVLTNSGEWHGVVAKAKTRENASVVQVVAQGVPNLVVTPDHKIMAKRGGGRNAKDNLSRLQSEWTEAKDIEGCYVKSVVPPEMRSDIPSKEWWIIGRWLADGHIDARGHQFILSVGKNKWEDFKNVASGYIGHVADKEDCNCYQVGLVNLSEKTRAVLRACGKGAKNKVMPVECISLNGELSESLYHGYMSGDGHYMANGKETACSVSRALMLGMAIVAQKVKGKVPSVYAGRRERDSEIQGRLVHCNAEWNMVVSPHYSFSAIEEDGAWKKVKRVDECGTADVWSIEVEGDHSFMAEGCVVKNCPLQLTVIRRAVQLWTNPNDIVLTPFLGIGSEAYVALEEGRRAIGVELKPSYYDQAVRNCEDVCDTAQMNLFED